MKAKRAVEILEGLPDTLNNDPDSDQREAINLGKEALKKWRSLKELGAYYVGGLLPGETPEGEEE